MRAPQAAAGTRRRMGGGDVGASPGRRRRITALQLFVVPRLALLALGGCGGGLAVTGGPGGGSGLEAAAPADPVEVVEAFLVAAGRRDHAGMARHFGTAGGPIGDRGGTVACGFLRVGSWIGVGDRCLTGREVELRMDLIAAILAHQSYRVGAWEVVAGKGRRAVRVEVEVDAAGRRSVVVPFVVIESGDGRWLVEEVGLGGLVK